MSVFIGSPSQSVNLASTLAQPSVRLGGAEIVEAVVIFSPPPTGGQFVLSGHLQFVCPQMLMIASRCAQLNASLSPLLVCLHDSLIELCREYLLRFFCSTPEKCVYKKLTSIVYLSASGLAANGRRSVFVARSFVLCRPQFLLSGQLNKQTQHDSSRLDSLCSLSFSV